MINMTVIKLKDVLRYLIGITIVISTVIVLTRYFSNIHVKNQEINLKSELNKSTKAIEEKSMVNCIGETVTTIKMLSKKNEPQDKKNENSITKKILGLELGMTKTVSQTDTSEYDEQIQKNEPKETENNQLEEVKTNVKTEVIDKSQVNTKYTNTYGSVKIKNESKNMLTEEMLLPNIELNNKKDVLIFHTHTTESYTQSEKYKYQESGTYRTTDLDFSVARVGTELENYLKEYKYNVIHDKTYHDYPAYTGSYGRSLITVQNQLKLHSNVQMVFDVHRDAIADNSYAPTVKIGDEYAAQIMFVIGTDGGGLSHPNWNQNLKFAIKIQEKANELYPGLFKPIILTNSRYNQQVTNAATIIEIGATGNTLDQSIVSMKYLSKVISETIK